MNDHSNPEPRKLLANCRSLMGRALEISRRHDASSEWPREAQRAASFLELALLALQELSETDTESVDAWAANLTARLLEWERENDAGLLESVPDEDEPEPVGVVTEDSAPAFEGDSVSIPIPELLGFLQMQEKTGLLRVSTSAEEFVLHLESGVLSHASSDHTPRGLRLGEILVDKGAITERALKKFLRRHRKSTARIGDALSQEELVGHDELRTALEFQVQKLFNRLFKSERARFAFYEGRSGEADGDLRMNVIQLLLESARFHDQSNVG